MHSAVGQIWYANAQACKDLYYFCIKHCATVQPALKEPITTAADGNFNFVFYFSEKMCLDISLKKIIMWSTANFA